MLEIKFITWDEETDGIAVEHNGREVWRDGAHDSWDQYFRHHMPRGMPALLSQDTRPSEQEDDYRDGADSEQGSRYRSVPAVSLEVEARQVTDASADEVAEWCDAIVYTGSRHGHTTPPWTMHTCITLCDPDQAAYAGYWVVKHPNGIFEVCDPGEFADRFEPVPFKGELATVVDDLAYLAEHGALAGVAEVIRERRRQIEVLHLTPELDDVAGADGGLLHVAASYLARVDQERRGGLADAGTDEAGLRSAGACAAAEIDRLNRLTAGGPE